MIRPSIFVTTLAAIVLTAIGSVPVRAEMSLRHATASTTAWPQTDTVERRLEERGLVGEHRVQGNARIEPPGGAEVYETVERAASGGQVMSRTTSWSEPLDGDILWIEMTDYPSRQYQVSFWALSAKSRGCTVFGRTMYSQHGRRLKSEFWRNDRALKITGAADFPPDLYPSAVPAMALPHVLGSLQDGAHATLNQQITPYGYVDLQITAHKAARLRVAAGVFSACAVTSQPDVARLLPDWPHMLLRVVNPFIPATTYYFQCESPYRFLRKDQEGSPLVGGPEATTELERYYTAGSSVQTSGAGGWANRPLASLKPSVR